MNYKAIVIGSSAGGLSALKELLVPLKKDFRIPIIIVQHISPQSDNYITTYLNNLCQLNVKEADQKEIIKKGNVYFATPNFHLLVEENFSLSLTTEKRLNYDLQRQYLILILCLVLQIQTLQYNNQKMIGCHLIFDN